MIDHLGVCANTPTKVIRKILTKRLMHKFKVELTDFLTYQMWDMGKKGEVMGKPLHITPCPGFAARSNLRMMPEATLIL